MVKHLAPKLAVPRRGLEAAYKLIKQQQQALQRAPQEHMAWRLAQKPLAAAPLCHVA